MSDKTHSRRVELRLTFKMLMCRKAFFRPFDASYRTRRTTAQTIFSLRLRTGRKLAGDGGRKATIIKTTRQVEKQVEKEEL
jgi:hypothetical protein